LKILGFFSNFLERFQFKQSNSYSNNQILIQTDQSQAATSLPPTGPNGRR
jgi:hypothetical protein